MCSSDPGVMAMSGGGSAARSAADLYALQAIADSASALCSLPVSETTSTTADILERLRCYVKEHGDLVSFHIPMFRHTLHSLRIGQLKSLVKLLQEEVKGLYISLTCCSILYLPCMKLLLVGRSVCNWHFHV